MLAKRHRLTKRQFDTYFKTGTRTHGQYMQIIHAPHERFHGAVVVGKKVYRRAVDRNRLRRRVYGVLYGWHKAQPVVGVYIVILKPAAAKVPYQLVAEECRSLLGRTE